MALRPVDPRTISNKGPGHRGRVSYPLLKEFMESEELMSAIEMEDLPPAKLSQKLMSTRATVSYYIKSRDLPVQVFQRDNELYLARLDKEMLEDGTIVDVPDWRDIRDASSGTDSGANANDQPEPISMDVLNKQYEENKNAVTK